MSIKIDNWNQFIGQADLKARLQVHIQAALDRGDRLDHVFLAAPPGSGKTSLAELVASEMLMEFMVRVAPVKPAVFKTIVRDFEGVLLIDEIHRMTKSEQESILVLLSEHYLETDYSIIENDFITIIGATTEPEHVIIPLRARFPIAPAFAEYTDAEMAKIVQQMGHKLGLTFSEKNAVKLAHACNGVPRSAEQFVIAARDLDTQDATHILRFLNYTSDGLSLDHVKYMDLLCRSEILGLDTLSTFLGQSKQQVVLLERLLVNKGLLTFSKSGRVATTLAHKLHKEKSNAKDR